MNESLGKFIRIRIICKLIQNVLMNYLHMFRVQWLLVAVAVLVLYIGLSRSSRRRTSSGRHTSCRLLSSSHTRRRGTLSGLSVVRPPVVVMIMAADRETANQQLVVSTGQ